MPRVIVTTDHPAASNVVSLDERVIPADLTDDRQAEALIERLGWAITEAEDAENRRPAVRQVAVLLPRKAA
jgi:hypothetical protein